MLLSRHTTRRVRVGQIEIGGGAPISVQSMCSTPTTQIDAAVRQAEALREAGASLVRFSVDTSRDVEALAEIRRSTTVALVADLQENYRLAASVAPHVHKIRYNPGHLQHHEKGKGTAEKVAHLAAVARVHDLAIRVGVNAGSLDPRAGERFPDRREAMVESALEHAKILDGQGFERYVVSLKCSDPAQTVEANLDFAARRPDVPLHIGVTEAGLPPDGIWKTRIAVEQLLARGVGDTVRVSLTLPAGRKADEVLAGQEILADIEAGRFRSVPPRLGRLRVVSCPACGRVESERFVDLAMRVREMAVDLGDLDLTIAVMGCRVNGPGETDGADLGLWCGPATVHLKRGSRAIGTFGYDEILARVREELDARARHGAEVQARE
ncbi:MAG: (E)-4-hydroxy-3-methylbut-2-enyl-diphosphate synthase [Planctomycetes bacterium]|nr:(E)-4-hydroxy-3-methylbut-2-enyl-diphosphate synthase [Planctomycetota bacterium]